MLEKPFSKVYPQKRVQIALLILFCFLLFFVNLNRWDLWNPDEPRYTQVAKGMVERGNRAGGGIHPVDDAGTH